MNTGEIEDTLLSHLTVNSTLDNININTQTTLDSIHPNIISTPTILDSTILDYNQNGHKKRSSSDSDYLSYQEDYLVAKIQKCQQHLSEYQEKLQHLQKINFKIENAKSPPKQIPYKTVTWYSRWASSNSPFQEKIFFHVKVNAKNETLIISTLKKKRNAAKANLEDYNKIIDFCKYLFASMEYLENEQSDILNDAFKLLRECKKNCIEACNILGKLYLYGIKGEIGHIPNYEKARPYFMRVLKNSKIQSSETAYNLGICYEKNTESDKKRSHALSFYKFAGINGHPGASFRMYKLYENISPKEAVKWLKLSKRDATKEFPDGLYEYAILSYKGFEEGGIEKNEKHTVSLLKEAAEKYEHIQSAIELGKYYINTEGSSSINAGKYLYIAASQNSKIAQYKLATWWSKQPVKSEMRKKACFEWLVCAAEGKEGLKEAIYKVGHCYEIGCGCVKDEQKALSYYENAALKGYSLAIQKMEKVNHPK